MSIKGAIFDLDGVIVNTVPLHFKAWKRMFKEYGHEFTMADYLSKVDGRPRLEGAAAVLTQLSPAEIEKAGQKKQSYYLEYLGKEPVEVFRTSVRLLEGLKAKGIKLASASSSKNATRILKKIDLLKDFDVNVSGADFEKGKPDPEIFLTAASKLGVAPKECVVFEDAAAGVAAALGGGFICVAVDRHNKPQALTGARKIVRDLGELKPEDVLELGRAV